MLSLLFQIGAERYALDGQAVVEVVPRVRLDSVPGAPEWMPGILRYRGRRVPVADLSVLAGLPPCPVRLSTRIILVRHPSARDGRLLGLVAERVTDAARGAGPAGCPVCVDALVPPHVLTRIFSDDEPPANAAR